MYLFAVVASIVLIALGASLGSTGLLVAGVAGAVLCLAVLGRMFQLRASHPEALMDWIHGGTLAIVRDVGGRAEILDGELVFTKRVFLDTHTGEFGLKKALFGIPYSFRVRPGSDFRDIDYRCEAVKTHRWHYARGRYGGLANVFRRGAIADDHQLELFHSWRLQLVPRGGGPRTTLVDYTGRYNERTRLFMDRIRERVVETLKASPPA